VEEEAAVVEAADLPPCNGDIGFATPDAMKHRWIFPFPLGPAGKARQDLVPRAGCWHLSVSIRNWLERSGGRHQDL
jgi:hypothetical protein